MFLTTPKRVLLDTLPEVGVLLTHENYDAAFDNEDNGVVMRQNQ